MDYRIAQMIDKTGNHKIHPPKLAITRNMITEGKIKLDQLTAEDDDEVCEITDDLLVAEVFLAMWNAYWAEVMAEQRKKDSPANVIMMPKNGILRSV